MQKLIINGGKKLSGEINISGAKNAALPLMVACLLTDKKLTLSNMPELSDIATMAQLLAEFGVEVMQTKEDEWEFNAKNVNNTTAPYDIVRKMRASVVVLGALLAKFGKAKVSLPGGCAIGTRPVDLHLLALEAMGAEIELKEGYIYAKATKNGKLQGAEIHFPKVSVGATENAVMASCLAEGTTILHNAAREPEVTDLIDCLVKMGADIEGRETSTLTINGKSSLNGAKHNVLADRIEAASYAIAGIITKGDVTLNNAPINEMGSFIEQLENAGAKIDYLGRNSSKIKIAYNSEIKPLSVTTAPYPGFPTDDQAQLMALMALANGRSIITEAIFENRFMHVPELNRMGANISADSSTAIIEGVDSLHGAEVMATDLRASFSLILAGLAAKGTTTLNRLYHLDRGYEKIVRKLQNIGADVERV